MEENLADLGGMITIVTAQMLIQTKNTTDLQHLPGLTQYTNEQMMLVRASQVRTSKCFNFLLRFNLKVVELFDGRCFVQSCRLKCTLNN